jgi:hypothetical protein
MDRPPIGKPANCGGGLLRTAWRVTKERFASPRRVALRRRGRPDARAEGNYEAGSMQHIPGLGRDGAEQSHPVTSY